MKKTVIIAISLLAMSLMFSGMAFAENGGFYGSIKAGGSFLDATKSASSNGTAPTGASSKFKTDTGMAIGGAIGYNWIDSDLPIRTELEYMYHGDFKYQYSDSNSSLTDKINLHTMMLNGYWDFYNSTSFTPYINGGVGVAWIQEEFSTGTGASAATISSPKDKTTSNFAFNLGAGVGWNMTESVILDLAYRYNYYGSGKEVTASGTNKSITSQIKDIGTHDVLLGLRYQF
ncbi:MAG: outer membrane beta-barrel protein [Pseudodesulfovibrio sp.]|nr:outer membrane beta-barrel protein [Pseudodesulfovibrio sp.]